MTATTYCTIWHQTQSAEKYLRRKGLAIYYDSVPSGYGEAVSNSDSKAIDHVRKTYSQALVVFVPAEQVSAMQAHKEAALDNYFAKVWAE